LAAAMDVAILAAGAGLAAGADLAVGAAGVMKEREAAGATEEEAAAGATEEVAAAEAAGVTEKGVAEVAMEGAGGAAVVKRVAVAERMVVGAAKETAGLAVGADV